MRHWMGVLAAVWLLALTANVRTLWAADEAAIRGTVVDSQGGAVPDAAIALLRDGRRVKDGHSDRRGAFAFEGLAEGRYQIEVSAPGFETWTTDPAYLGTGGHVTLDVRLQIGAFQQQVVVTAAAGVVSEAQIGAPVTVIDSTTLQNLGNSDLLEPLRTVPGAAVVQAGGRGGITSLFVRGGSSNFNKVLVDGVPANDIGGAFDFGDLAATGVERVEVLRGSNSVLYGSDAMTSVVSISTRRGRSRIPEAIVSIDGGNFSTSRADVSIGGAVNRVDYFADYSHLQTDNDVPNNAYRNDTFAGRYGVMAGTHTDVSATVRWIDTKYGSPNAINHYGMADDMSQTRTTTFASVNAQSQITDRWQSTIRFGMTDQDSRSTNPTPTGEPYDPFGFGASYLGAPVTIHGANGYSVTGRAILDYSGSYPSVFHATVRRRSLLGLTNYHVASGLDLAAGVRYENEHGTSEFSSLSETDRDNYGAFAEARGAIARRLYVSGGIGVDHNAVFGYAMTPRVSIAGYLREPSATHAFGDTKLTLNVGNGIKAPSLGQELSSLFALMPPTTASALGIEAIGPERSRTLDLGVEQGIAGRHGRVRVAYFNNEFQDLVEFVSKNVLPQIGVPPEAAAASGFGAYVNSQSNRARGLETSGEAVAGRLKFTGSYMYLDAVVTKSFGSGALNPAINPAFPGIQIGAFSPLVGARPFRRPTNSGSLTATYSDERAQVTLAGYFFGKMDDSTFLNDPDFGHSMLLPNRNLGAAYQKFDLSGSYRIHPRLRWYITVENAFDQRFQAAAGFPALPRAVRSGATVVVGGDRVP
jgi:vitamin B12 transporter